MYCYPSHFSSVFKLLTAIIKKNPETEICITLAKECKIFIWAGGKDIRSLWQRRYRMTVSVC